MNWDCGCDPKAKFPCATPGCSRGICGSVLRVPILPENLEQWWRDSCATPEDVIVRQKIYRRRKYTDGTRFYFVWVEES